MDDNSTWIDSGFVQLDCGVSLEYFQDLCMYVSQSYTGTQKAKTHVLLVGSYSEGSHILKDPKSFMKGSAQGPVAMR